MNTFRFTHILLAFAALLVGGSLGCDDGGPPALPPEQDMEVPADIGLGAVQISSPSDGDTLTAADDLDGDLTNGLQLKVVIVTSNPTATVTLTVPGSEPVTAGAVGGRVEFDASLAGDRNENYRLVASVSDEMGNTTEDAVTVQVRTGNCMLQVFPQPRGAGCDLGADADDDPNTPGLQTTLRAETNCDQVTFTVNNLPSQPVVVENGEASLAVTLRDGENTITVSVTDGIVDPVVVGPYPLNVSTAGPAIALTGLSDTRPNVFLLEDGEQQGGQVYWTMRGTASGIAAGQTLAVTTEPALDDAPAQVTVDENGQFRLELALARGGYYAGTVSLTGTDTCGVEGTSAAYSLQLDGVVPEVRITGPVDGQLLIFAQDTDPLRAGAQIPVTVEVTDPRPASVDYAITIECAAVGGAPTFIDRARQGGDPINRSDLLDDDPSNDSIIVTFQQSEAGEFICRAALAEGSNPVLATETVWRAFFERPNLGLLSPDRAPACVTTNTVELIGIGDSLDGNRPDLSVVVTPEGGEAGPSIALDPLGGERYGYTFTPQTLPDGRYTLAVSGSVLGEVPVEVSPEELSVVIHRTTPSVDFVSPGANGVFTDVEPATPGTQSQITVTACGVSGQMLTVNSVPPLPGFPQMVEVPEGQACSEIALGAVTVPLGPVALDASVVDQCGALSEASLVAAIPAENTEARITSPTAGTSVNMALDNDEAREGCQIQLDVIGQGLGEGAEFNVCTNVAQGAAAAGCAGRSSALDGVCRITGATPSGSLIACPISLQQGSHQLTFVGVFGDRVESAPVDVTVDCQAPSVTSVSIVQDENADGCIHSQERGNRADPAGTARVTVRLETVGMENGQTVRVRAEGGAVLASGVVTDNIANVAVDLLDGDRRVYATGTDAAGNELPSEGPGFVDASIRIDTVAPTPALVNVNEAACLNAAADEDGAAEDLQYGVQIATGREVGEQISARMLIDGVVNGLAIDEADNLSFPPVTMGQGGHEIAVTVTDTCGNVGSVSGFDNANGVADWTSPRSVSVIVDTIVPGLELQGIAEGTVLVADDDADGDSSNGFQIDLAANLVPFSALSGGQTIQVEINGVPAPTSPSPLTVPENVVGALPVRVTLSPGPQNISLAATDSCGNSGRSQEVSAQLDIAGCTSRITSFDANPAILGPGDAVVNGNSLVLNISGAVDLLDAACAGANVQLIVDGNPVAGSNVGADGDVTFADVQLTEGDHNLSYRVGPVAGNTIESPNQAVSVDLSTPNVVIVQPAADAIVLTDSNAQLDGQQAVVQVDVSEAAVVTQRTATLEIDGVQFGSSLDLAQGSPLTVTFPDVTLAGGVRILGVCVSDAAGNSNCTEWAVNADSAAPATLADLSATIENRRSTEVNLNFTAPGDDGAEGERVEAYEIRRSATSFVDEAAWENAAATSSIISADVDPGEAVQIVVSGSGGASVSDGLALNELHFVAVRALDDAGRNGGIAEVEVDLLLTQRVIDFVPTAPPWTDNPAFNRTSVVIGVSDVDGDGLDDVLVTRAQGLNETVASIVFGTQDGQDAVTVNLERTANTGPGYFGAGGGAIGDVNGDGAPDFAVLGFTDDFSRGTASIYFGCALCERGTLGTPAVQITADAGRFFGVITAAGNFNQRAGDQGAYGDLFIGGSISAASQHQTSYIIAGRDDWPAEIQLSDDPAAVPAGVTILRIPDSKSGQAAASVGDLDGDGSSDIAFSAGNPNIVYLFDGGADLPAIIDYDVANPDTRSLSDPCSDPDGFGAQIVGGVNLDGDGADRPDFAVGDGINRRVSVFDHTAANIDCFGRSRSLFGARFDLAGDIDGDGLQDIIVSHDAENTDAFIFYNDGQGQFGNGNVASPRGYHVLIDESDVLYQGVAGVGDFNGDGRDDFAVAVKQPGVGNLQVIIYY